MSHTQSLKSAFVNRVDTGKANHLYASARSSGESLMCPASAHVLQHDIYGRPASQNTLTVNLDAACAQGSQFPAYRHIQIENNNRPYIPVASAGMRGAADFMLGNARDVMPMNLYGEGARGHFVRHSNLRNGALYEAGCPQSNYIYHRIEPVNDFSHDATRSAYVGH